MSEEIDVLAQLKIKADLLGVPYSNKIGVEKLRERIQAKQAELASESEATPAEPVDTALARKNKTRMEKYKEANALVRVRITCMNPAKSELNGEIFTAGNDVVGSLRKFVPFNADEGWHVPQILLNMIRSRKYVQHYDVKDENGRDVKRRRMVNEFAVEVLPDLTEAERLAIQNKYGKVA